MYKPQNITVYSAAFSGSFSGMTCGKWLVSTDPTRYTTAAQVAEAYAEAFDTLWGTSPPDTYQVLAIDNISKCVFAERSSTPLSNAQQQAALYNGIAQAVLAVVQSGQAEILAQGITPNPWPDQPAISQTDFWIDPQNRTGLANDANSGTSPSAPVLTWNGGVIRRYGTKSPILSNNPLLTIYNYHFMSSSPNNDSDPIDFTPTVANQASVRFSGTFDAHNIVGSGALAGVVAKNRATGQVLEADLAAVAGAAPGMVLVNTTAGKASRCIVGPNVAGTVFILTQPITIVDDWPLHSDPTEVDTYANGDTFSLYNEDLIDLVNLQPIVTEFDPNFAAQFSVVTGLGILNPTTIRNMCYVGDVIGFLYSVMNRRIILTRPAFGRNTLFFGCQGLQGLSGGTMDSILGNTCFLEAGIYGSVEGIGILADEDVIFTNTFARMIGAKLGAVAVISGAGLDMSQETILTDLGNGAVIYGAGAINVGFGRLLLEGVTATNGLKVSGGITIDGQTHAFTATQANPSVINGDVTINVANIDANGTMYFPGGGSISVVGP